MLGVRKEFEIPFQFKGDPVTRATLSGLSINRCVLDTGAANTVMRIPSETPADIKIDISGFANLQNLAIEGIDFGPLQVRVRYVDGLLEPELYLGTDQMKSYCVVFDYKNSVAKFTKRSALSESPDASMLRFSSGRPVIILEIGGLIKKFVLDSGSNGNWLFFSAQTPEILKHGSVHSKKDLATCGLGDIQINNEILFSGLNIGGVEHESIAFNLADKDAFGGPQRTIEDGIVGTGYFESSRWKLHTVDFISMKYKMT